MDNSTLKAYVLVSASIDGKGSVHEAIAGVTFSLFDAEKHRDAAIENDFKGPFAVDPDFQDHAAISESVGFIRESVALIHADIERSLA
jgi:hypothetical protein